MNCPKYIIEALKKRIDGAVKLIKYDCIVSNFCDKHQIDVEQYDVFGGVEIVTNPYDSAERILKAIEEHRE